MAPCDSQLSSRIRIFLSLIIFLIFLISAGNPIMCAKKFVFVFLVIFFLNHYNQMKNRQDYNLQIQA